MKRLFLLLFSILAISFFVRSQPANPFEIERILVDACGAEEGFNEMVYIVVGANPIQATDLMNDITVDWPNISLNWEGLKMDATTATKVTELNGTITNGCGALIEPLAGWIPANSKVILFTSYLVSAADNSFALLEDTLYAIFQNHNVGPTVGHFANSGTGIRTLIITTVNPAWADTVSYDRALIDNANGAMVIYDYPGNAVYENFGCNAPFPIPDSSWVSPGNVCHTDAPLDLSTLVTGTTGGTFTGTGVTGNMFDPAGLSDTVAITYSIGVAPCEHSETHDIVVFTDPVAFSGADTAILCGTSLQILPDSASTNIDSLLWQTTGDGTFNFPNALHSTYSPGPADCGGGTATISLTAYNLCGDSVHDFLLTIVPYAEAFAGNDTTICPDSLVLNTAIVQYYDSLLWQTSGDGTFSDSLVENPVYTPGAADVVAGTVTLTVTAFGPLNDSTDQIVVAIINTTPTAYAGSDTMIVSGNSYSAINATASNSLDIIWTTDGDGSFVDSAAVNAVYQPGAIDLLNDSVVLYIAANGGCDTIQDTIIVYLLDITTAFAGNDTTICPGPLSLNIAVVQNEDSLLWQTSGDGVFSDVHVENPVYSPGLNDITAGSVTITLYAYGIMNDSIDSFVITIHNTPISVNAGSNTTLTAGTPYFAGSAVASGFDSLLWATTGDGAFSDTGVLDPTYTPGASDSLGGYIDLILVGYSMCGNDTDSVTIQYMLLPTVSAGNDGLICETDSYSISSSSETITSSIVWTTSGDGYFSSDTILHPVYFPGSFDIASGSVTLVVSGTNAVGSDTDTMVLSLQTVPVAVLPADFQLCSGDTVLLDGSGSSDFTGLQWSATGTGAFLSSTDTLTTYFPTSTDYQTGTVSIILTTTGISPCGSDKDTLVVTFQPLPVANAGVDITICEGSNVNLAGAMAANETSVHWTSSGTGSFSNPNTLNPGYIPSQADVSAGSVQLTLTASSGCGTSINAMDVTINRMPQVEAGTNQSVCQGDTVHLTDAAYSYASIVQWTTGGSGVLIAPTIINASYIPGYIDASNGTVVLYVTATGICGSAIDSVFLSVNALPYANAGVNQQICLGDSALLIATGGTSYLWSNGVSGSNNAVSPASSMNYTVTATNNCGISTDAVHVTVWPLPVATISPDTEIVYSGSVELIATGGTSYLWVPETSLSNAAIATPLAAPLETTIYSVAVSDGRCVSVLTVTVIVG
ncbi:MAG: hypothetical protein KKA07_14890, partial [Bacteroidetes bacterium]|nr:hypothetical protein [Bacteroidota bacterium]